MPQVLPQFKLSGWKAWDSIPTTMAVIPEAPEASQEPETGTAPETAQEPEIFRMSFGAIPPSSVPSSKFQIWLPINNGNLKVPWKDDNLLDPFALAFTGTLVGVLGTIAIQSISLLQKQKARYALWSGDGYGPIIGYCLGEQYAERVYYDISAIKNNATGETIVLSANDDVFQRYRPERFILHHGLIENYTRDDFGEYLSLGIGEIQQSVLNETATIKIYKKDGSIIDVNITGFMSNGDAAIEPPESGLIEVGDFYELDKVFFLDDPYLLAGLWRGTESENAFEGEIQSIFNLPETLNQKFYAPMKILGGYALLDADGAAKVGGVGASMASSEGDHWGWWLANQEYFVSDSYGETKNRPVYEVGLEIPPTGATEQDDAAASIITEQEWIEANRYVKKSVLRKTCTQEDVLFGVTSGISDHVRIEIDSGGSYSKNNFHAPLLKNEFILQNSKYFKVLAHIDAATLDVSYTSIDGTAKLSLTEPITILNQYAWKITEHYSGTQKQPWGAGTVSEAKTEDGQNTLKIKSYFSQLSSGTMANAIGGSEGKYPYLNRNSFSERYRLTYKNDKSITTDLYKKGKGWVVSNLSGLKFAVEELVSLTTGVDDVGGFYLFEFSMKSASLEVGSYAYVLFGEPYIREGTYNGQSDFITEVRTRDSIWIRGGWSSGPIVRSLSANTIFGICDSYLWGLQDLQNIGEGTMAFISTPEGFLSVSSLYQFTPHKEYVLYSDYKSQKTTLRIGSEDFSEFPVKNEIAVGKYAKEETFTENPLVLNREFDRLSAVNLNLSETNSPNEGFVTFGVGDINSYYGASISGGGQINLIAITDANRQTPGSILIEPTDIRNGSVIVSPVYFYKKGFNSASSHRLIPLGMATSNQKVFFQQGIQSGKIESIEAGIAMYIYDSQTLSPYGASDFFIMPDGEQIVLYNKIFEEPLKIDNNVFNDSSAAVDSGQEPWKYTKSCIMAIGMHGHMWGTPVKKDVQNQTGVYSIPIMIANATEYLFSVYDRYSRRVLIFARCYDNSGAAFLGMFSLAEQTLFWPATVKPKDSKSSSKETESVDTMLFGCPKDSKASKESVLPEHYAEMDMPFWFRPLKIGESIRTPELTYTSTKNIPKFEGVSDENNGDIFVRVYGEYGTKSQIEGEVLPPYHIKQTKEGYLVIFIYDIGGITFIFSSNLGKSWGKSPVYLSKSGSSAFMIDDDNIYYNVDGVGIYEKKVTSDDLAIIIHKINNTDNSSEGETERFAEIQSRINESKTVLIGTGPVGSQKFSGHVTASGTKKIFFYDQNTYLSCIQSKKHGDWTISDNF